MTIKPLNFYGKLVYRYKILLRRKVAFMYTLKINPSEIMPILSKHLPIHSYKEDYYVYCEGVLIGKIKKNAYLDGDPPVEKKVKHNPISCKHCQSFEVKKNGVKKLAGGGMIQMIRCRSCKRNHNINMSTLKKLQQEAVA